MAYGCPYDPPCHQISSAGSITRVVAGDASKITILDSNRKLLLSFNRTEVNDGVHYIHVFDPILNENFINYKGVIYIILTEELYGDAVEDYEYKTTLK